MAKITITIEDDDIVGRPRISTNPDFKTLKMLARSKVVTSAQAYALLCINTIAQKSLFFGSKGPRVLD